MSGHQWNFLGLYCCGKLDFIWLRQLHRLHFQLMVFDVSVDAFLVLLLQTKLITEYSIRPPDRYPYVGSLHKRCCIFYETLHRAAAVHQMYTRGSSVEYTRCFYLAFLPSPDFTGGRGSKIAKFVHVFDDARNGVRYLKSNFNFYDSMIALCASHIWRI